MTYIINNNFSIICYHWSNGAYISGNHFDFENDLNNFISQFGYPNKITSSIVNSEV